MNEFHTVFQIAPGPGEIEADITSRLIIGFIVLAFAVSAIVLFVHRRNSTQWRPKLSTVIFLPIWSVIWLGVTIPWFFSARHERQKLFATYQDGRYEVVEGPVRVIRTQPKSGHAPGDLILISNKFFEINYFVSTHAYHQSIAHGGYLHNGVVARVFYVGTNILRIDILNAEFPLSLGNDNEINPSSAEIWFSMGADELARRRFADAEKAFRKAIEFYPEHFKAWMGLGVVLMETNRTKEAEQVYSTALYLKPSPPGIVAELLTNRGNARSKLGDKEAALADFHSAFRSDPTYVNASRSLGILKMETREYKEAKNALSKVVTSSIVNADDWALFGESLEYLGDKKHALEALKEAEKIDPNNLRVLTRLAGYFGRSGEPQKALNYLERSLKIDPSSAVSWSSKGYALLKLGRMQDSISALEIAVKLDPQFANAWINLGDAQMHNLDIRKSIQSLEKALSLAPAAVDARYYLAQSYLSTGQTEKARTHANTLLKSNPDLPQAWTILTLSYLMDNNAEAALNSYRKIQAQNPQTAKAIRSMAVSQGLPGSQALPE